MRRLRADGNYNTTPATKTQRSSHIKRVAVSQIIFMPDDRLCCI
jgi:hypothetical protein